MSNKETLKNSEIIFLYEVKLANPNGDPDDENRPRIDPKTRTNFVTDVRLKRFFRDYYISKFGEDTIWVSMQKGERVDATTRFNNFKSKEEVLEKCIDARLFGATIPKKASLFKGDNEEQALKFGATIPKKASGNEKGESISYTGPLQLAWGYSLHKVDMMDTRSITSLFSGRVSGEENIGKDYRVYYSLIAFYGAFNKLRAEKTKCTGADLEAFDNYLWDAVKSESITRSKIGHYPHLYLRVEWDEDDKFYGDLRRLITVKQKSDAVRSLNDLEIELGQLNKALSGQKVYGIYSDEFREKVNDLKQVSNFVELPHREHGA